MNIKNEDLLGKIGISDEMLIIEIKASCLNCKGVKEMADVMNMAFSIPGLEITAGNGIRLSRQDKKISVEVFVIVEYGVQIPTLAWELQQKIKEDLEAITESEIVEINIHVQGVAYGD